MLKYVSVTFVLLITYLGNGIVAAQVISNHPSISNESDYKFVFEQMEKQIQIAPNRENDFELQRYLTDLSCELSAKYCHEIRIHVIEEPDFNAHMFPNGALILNTGLLLRLENKAQLAYIISHELAHYVYKHGVKKINHKRSTSSSTNNFNPFKAITRFGNNVAVNRYSRQLEHQADLFSIELLSKKKLALMEVARMFEDLKLENTIANKVNKGGFSSSHPGTEERIKLFNHNATKTLYRKSQSIDSWSIIRAKFIDSWLDSELSKRRYKSTLFLIKRLQANSISPRYFDFYIGEIYRKQGGEKNAKIAISYYKKHLKNVGTPIARVYKALGDSYTELNTTDKARDYYNQYINLVPKPKDLKIIQSELARL